MSRDVGKLYGEDLLDEAARVQGGWYDVEGPI